MRAIVGIAHSAAARTGVTAKPLLSVDPFCPRIRREIAGHCRSSTRKWHRAGDRRIKDGSTNRLFQHNYEDLLM